MKPVALLLMLFQLVGTAHARESVFAPTQALGDTELELKGTGDMYYARFIHVYDAALYGPAGLPAPMLLETGAPACLELVYRVGLDRDKFVLAAERILARQHGDLSSLRPRIDALHAAYRDVAEGDRYRLCYDPDAGTELALNDAPLVRVQGEDFARAYLGIWLGERPLSDSLRTALLDGG
ncbi:MAG TPA: hypothetical protein ENN42_08825 [Thioalkalivibrio sp.]|nr:hypothetical protein [Thioalkalivibrio sp.]